MLGSSCPICGGPGRRYIDGTVTPAEYFCDRHPYAIAAGKERQMLDILRCSDCGHGWTPATGADSAGWYRSAPRDMRYMAEEPGRRKTAQRILGMLARHVSSTDGLLEIGAGPGFLVAEALSLGWRAQGMEVAVWALEEAARRGLKSVLRSGTVDDVQYFDTHSMSAVCAIDVLEHVQNPLALLVQCARIIRHDGCVVIVTPQFDSLLARIAGKRWYCLMPAHLHYFSRTSLLLALQRAGLVPIVVRHHVRHFSAAYLMERLVAGTPATLPRFLRRWMLPAPLCDTLEVFAKPMHDELTHAPS